MKVCGFDVVFMSGHFLLGMLFSLGLSLDSKVTDLCLFTY